MFESETLAPEYDILKAVVHERTGNAYISSTNGLAGKPTEDLDGVNQEGSNEQVLKSVIVTTSNYYYQLLLVSSSSS